MQVVSAVTKKNQRDERSEYSAAVSGAAWYDDERGDKSVVVNVSSEIRVIKRDATWMASDEMYVDPLNKATSTDEQKKHTHAKAKNNK